MEKALRSIQIVLDEVKKQQRDWGRGDVNAAMSRIVDLLKQVRRDEARFHLLACYDAAAVLMPGWDSYWRPEARPAVDTQAIEQRLLALVPKIAAWMAEQKGKADEEARTDRPAPGAAPDSPG